MKEIDGCICIECLIRLAGWPVGREDKNGLMRTVRFTVDIFVRYMRMIDALSHANRLKLFPQQ